MRECDIYSLICHSCHYFNGSCSWSYLEEIWSELSCATRQGIIQCLKEIFQTVGKTLGLLSWAIQFDLCEKVLFRKLRLEVINWLFEMYSPIPLLIQSPFENCIFKWLFIQCLVNVGCSNLETTQYISFQHLQLILYNTIRSFRHQHQVRWMVRLCSEL